MRIRIYIVIASLIILGLSYFLNYPILIRIYPKVSEDYYQYIDFVSVRFKLYDMMLACAFWIIFMVANNRFMKSFACFLMVLASCSFIDKAVFHVSNYLASDIIMVIVSLIVSINVYVRKV